VEPHHAVWLGFVWRLEVWELGHVLGGAVCARWGFGGARQNALLARARALEDLWALHSVVGALHGRDDVLVVSVCAAFARVGSDRFPIKWAPVWGRAGQWLGWRANHAQNARNKGPRHQVGAVVQIEALRDILAKHLPKWLGFRLGWDKGVG
jgi:hypothetical protein